MKREFWFVVSALALFSAPAWTEQVLGIFPADEATPGVKLPAGVSVQLDIPGSTDGKGALKVTYLGGPPVDVMLFHQDVPNIGDGVLWYEASIRGEGVAGKAYLEMWANFPDGNSYFSRALNQPVEGTKHWRASKTPFLLEKGRTPTSVDMGVRFEGPGTVWVDNARLVVKPKGNPLGVIMGVLGGLYGTLVGCWGALCGILFTRGKGIRFIFVSGVGFILLSAMMLVLGFFFYFTGQPYELWYPCVLSGGLVGVLITVLLPVMMRRRRQIEAQKMAAIEQSADL